MTENPVFPYGGRHHAAPIAGAPALEVRDLSVAYPGHGGPAIEGVTLSIPIGARVAVVGPNGAGKSTLLKAVAGLLPVRQGEIRIYGLPSEPVITASPTSRSGAISIGASPSTCVSWS